MTRRWLVALVFALVVVGALVYLMAVPRITVDGFLAEFEADLPRGTPRADVEAWLRKRGIGFLGFVDEQRRPTGLGGEVGGVYWLELFPTVIRFEVDFDRDGKLTKVSASKRSYMP
jgi:hypothetical protein